MPTVVELKALAKARGYSGYSKLRKDELLKLLSKKPSRKSPRKTTRPIYRDTFPRINRKYKLEPFYIGHPNKDLDITKAIKVPFEKTNERSQLLPWNAVNQILQYLNVKYISEYVGKMILNVTKAYLHLVLQIAKLHMERRRGTTLNKYDIIRAAPEVPLQTRTIPFDLDFRNNIYNHYRVRLTNIVSSILWEKLINYLSFGIKMGINENNIPNADKMFSIMSPFGIKFIIPELKSINILAKINKNYTSKIQGSNSVTYFIQKFIILFANVIIAYAKTYNDGGKIQDVEIDYALKEILTINTNNCLLLMSESCLLGKVFDSIKMYPTPLFQDDGYLTAFSTDLSKDAKTHLNYILGRLVYEMLAESKDERGNFNPKNFIEKLQLPISFDHYLFG